MFTGIIKITGRARSASRGAGGMRLAVLPEEPISDLEVGESIAVNGVCLTVEPGSSASQPVFFLSEETLARTNLGDLQTGAFLNLERALRVGDRLGGHFVMGHVDCVGEIRRLDRDGEAWMLEVGFPPSFRQFLAPKGSVAIDGISLTVVDVRESSFTVAIIPHTYHATSLRAKQAEATVNLEADVLARYVAEGARSAGESGGGVTSTLLERAGF